MPIVANVNGEFYPTGPDVVPQMLDLLAQQVASPVQFVKGLRTLYDAGARVFVEVGPKKALQGFAEEVLGDRGDVVSLFTNHPKVGDIVSLQSGAVRTVCGGIGMWTGRSVVESPAKPHVSDCSSPRRSCRKPRSRRQTAIAVATFSVRRSSSNGDRYAELGHLFADVLERGWQIYHGEKPASHQ